MTMKTEPDYFFSARGAMTMQSRLRIAIPSWRFFGRKAETVQEQSDRLSREEIVSLFQGELRTGKFRRLTDIEKRDQEIQDSIRRALYPAGEGTA